MMSLDKKTALPSRADALPGRDERLPVPATHFVNGNPLQGPFAEHLRQAIFGLGCFWGAERIFWDIPGVFSTSVGYAGGITPNPNYQEVCSGMTGHTEVVSVIFDPATVSYDELLRVFLESHDPTQGMRQGNDRGTQYRSAVYTLSDEQHAAARRVLDSYESELGNAGYGTITSEVQALDTYYYAEDYHQQYLAKNPDGYCGIGGTGVSCPVGPGIDQDKHQHATKQDQSGH